MQPSTISPEKKVNMPLFGSEFNGKVAVVTGARQGIGAAIADNLASHGALVIRLDIAYTAQEDKCYALDVTEPNAVNKTINYIEDTYGPISFAVNAAGILRMSGLLNTTDEDWINTFSVNTTGAFNFCRAVGQKMVTRKNGAIVAIGSNAANVPRIGMGAYAASKAATTQLIKCLGLELAEHNIRCNIVAPGSTDTAMQRQLWHDNNDVQKVIEGNLTQYRLGIPLQRIATPEHIAQSVVFLLSNLACHITLETLVIDGGATLGCT